MRKKKLTGFIYESHTLKNGSILQVRSFGRKTEFPYYEDLRYFIDNMELLGLSEFLEYYKQRVG